MSNLTPEERDLFLEGITLHKDAADFYKEEGEGFKTAKAENKAFVEEKGDELEARVDDLIKNRAQTMGEGRGSITFCVDSFFTAVGGSGFLHLKTPFVKTESGMFHFTFRGYLYGASNLKKALDDVVVGYQYSPAAGPVQVESVGSHDPTLYIGSDDHLYIRLTIQEFYFATVTVDSTSVGNGKDIDVGSCEFIRTASDIEEL